MREIFQERINQNLKKVPVWERKTLGDRFDDFVKKYAEREFIYTKEKQYTYLQTKQKVDQLAKALIKSGIKNREHVAMVMANYPETVFIKFGVAKTGAVNVPLNFRTHVGELRYVLHQSDSVCLITMDKWGTLNYIDMLKEMCPEVFKGKQSAEIPLLRHIIVFSPTGERYEGTTDFFNFMQAGKSVSDQELKAVQDKVCYPDEVSDILYTSGTTGRPKGVMLTHDMLWRKSYSDTLGRAIEDGRRIFVPLPLYHIFGYLDGILAAPWVGGAIIPQVAFEVEETLHLMQDAKANDILCVPTMAISLLSHPHLKKYDLSSLHAMYCAGAPAPLKLWEQLITDLGLDQLNCGYGMTETSAAPIQTQPGDSALTIATRCGRVSDAGAAGYTEYGGKCIQYKVIDPFTGEDLPQGQIGEIAARGPAVIRGYYKKPIETAEVFDKDGWLRSGDLGRFDENGYLELTGRSKELYRIMGENVAPKEIEEVVCTLLQVKQVYVIGVPEEKLGEVGMAYVILERGETCSEQEIIDFCRSRLSRIKVPKYVRFITEDELPLTTTGKVQKFKLKEMAIEKLGDSKNILVS